MTLPNRLGVIGVDEVGTGSLCGPLLVCATLVPIGYGNPRVRDSKKVGRVELRRLAIELMQNVQWVCVQASAATINAYGPKEAWCYAVMEAVYRLRAKCGIITPAFIDGNVVPDGLFRATSVIKGDAKYFQIAAAAIIAKYNRICIMRNLAQRYKGYDFANNDGYGVARHIAALIKLGRTPEHRSKACDTVIANYARKQLCTSHDVLRTRLPVR